MMNAQEMFWANFVIQVVGFVAVIIAVIATRGGKDKE